MDVFGVNIPYKPLSNFELFDFAKKLNINLHEIYMRNGLPEKPLKNESENEVKMVCIGLLIKKMVTSNIISILTVGVCYKKWEIA